MLGIRPDVIRASLVLRYLKAELGPQLTFIWSGQHYSDNLKDVFFRELAVEAPDIELGAVGQADADICADVIAKLFPVLDRLQPRATVFLGDTNTVVGCIAAAQLNVPVVHIEGCMRSYDWRMPEEKYRTVADHLSDVIYAYLEEYKTQGVAEGLHPERVAVVGNPIVDVLSEFYIGRKDHFDQIASRSFFTARGLGGPGRYYLMTCHRRENVHEREALERILGLTAQADRPVYFPASYRTQRVLRQHGLRTPSNVITVDPIGYEEFLTLMVHSGGVLTDSGTVVEEACILNVPSIQLRRSTERPQVYDVGASVKFDPTTDQVPRAAAFDRLAGLRETTWAHPFGDGLASRRIADDLVRRFRGDDFRRHRPGDYHVDVSHAYRSDAPERLRRPARSGAKGIGS